MSPLDFRHCSPAERHGLVNTRTVSPASCGGCILRTSGRVRHAGLANQFRRLIIFTGAAAAIALVSAQGTRHASANGDTRSLTFFHTHTNESATITFRRNGRYDEEALNQLNWLLRDWRVNEPAKMDARLFDILWDVYREVGSRQPIHVISAYRSPATNSMLRRRSRAVSEHSQHMSGKAMDIRLPDIDNARLRAAAMHLQYGGVGFYAGAAGFVHIDTGSVRAWPRMSRDQLARLFPDGKTAHLPSSGQPLPGYEQARVEIQARNATLAAAASDSRRARFASLSAEPGERSRAALPSNASAFAQSGSIEVRPPPTAAATPPHRPTDRTASLSRSGLERAPSGQVPSSENGHRFSSDEQAAIKALFSTSANDVALPSQPRLTIARVQPRPVPAGDMLVNVSPLVELGFAAKAIEPLSMTRFTGPAVKPLRNLRYAEAVL